MSTITLTNQTNIFAGANGQVTVGIPTLSSGSFTLVNLAVGPVSSIGQLKNLTDVVGANTGQDGYILQLDTHGTANTADDTFDVVPNSLDGGAF